MYRYNVGDVEIQLSKNTPFTVYGKSLFVSNNLVTFQFDEDVVKLMENELKGKINAITILHIPNETKVDDFYTNLKKLIKYIIFQQQNEIVYHNLWVVTTNQQLMAKAKDAITEEQRKITKNSYEIFPLIDKTCFGFDLNGYNFSLSTTFEQSYFGEVKGPNVETVESDLLPLSTDTKDGWKYIAIYEEQSSGDSSKSSSGSSSSQPVHKGYIRQDIVETWTLPIRGMYAVAMGIMCNSIENDNQTITVRRVVNPYTYGKYSEDLEEAPIPEKRTIKPGGSD